VLLNVQSGAHEKMGRGVSSQDLSCCIAK